MRILLSPFVFLGSQLVVIAGILFPTTIITIMSFWLFLATIGVNIINPTLKNKIYVDEPICYFFESDLLNHFLGMTVLIWFPWRITYNYIKFGKLEL